MAVGWWWFLSLPGVGIQWFGEDGVEYDANGNELIDASGNVVTNTLPRAMERVRYYNTTPNPYFLVVRQNDGKRTINQTLQPNTPQWSAEFSVPNPQQVDPGSCSVYGHW